MHSVQIRQRMRIVSLKCSDQDNTSYVIIRVIAVFTYSIYPGQEYKKKINKGTITIRIGN